MSMSGIGLSEIFLIELYSLAEISFVLMKGLCQSTVFSEREGSS